MTRDQHVAWCKQRALEYVDAGDLQSALASMGSDLNKHPETANHPAVKLGLMLLMTGRMTQAEMRRHIEGYK